MASHSSTLAWKIPWTEEPGRLQSIGSLRVGQLSNFTFTFLHWEGNGSPLQCSCLENPRDGGAWWAAVQGVAQSRTRLKWLSSSSSSSHNLKDYINTIQSPKTIFLPKSYFSWFVILSWTVTSIQENWCDGFLWTAVTVVFPLKPWVPCLQEQPSRRLQHMAWLGLPPEKPRGVGGPWEESHSCVCFKMLVATAREEAPGPLTFAYLGINLTS